VDHERTNGLDCFRRELESGRRSLYAARINHLRDAMIQTQTFAFDEATKRELQRLSELIYKHRNDPERLVGLLAAHDELTKAAPTKLYNPGEDA
jgi:hypothetical protein